MGRRVAVFGTRCLGAAHTACMAEPGHEVIGADIYEGKLAAGELPFYEPDLPQVLQKKTLAGEYCCRASAFYDLVRRSRGLCRHSLRDSSPSLEADPTGIWSRPKR